MHHMGCMTVLNLTWFRANPPPCLRQGFGRQAADRRQTGVERPPAQAPPQLPARREGLLPRRESLWLGEGEGIFGFLRDHHL